MTNAKQMLMISLESDSMFQNLLRNIKMAAISGTFQYTSYELNGNQNTDRYLEGLKELGFTVDDNSGTLYIKW